MDENLKTTLKKIPLLTINAGPRDGEQWIARLKEEFKALIAVCAGLLRRDRHAARLLTSSDRALSILARSRYCSSCK